MFYGDIFVFYPNTEVTKIEDLEKLDSLIGIQLKGILYKSMYNHLRKFNSVECDVANISSGQGNTKWNYIFYVNSKLLISPKSNGLGDSRAQLDYALNNKLHSLIFEGVSANSEILKIYRSSCFGQDRNLILRELEKTPPGTFR